MINLMQAVMWCELFGLEELPLCTPVFVPTTPEY